MLERFPGYVLVVSLAILALGALLFGAAPILGGIVIGVGAVPLVMTVCRLLGKARP